MGQIHKEHFVCIDCETTGLDPKQDRILEVAAVRFTLDETFDSFESLVDPECLIPETSIAIHHITTEMVVGKPKAAAILPELLQLVGKYTIIGHGIGFDIEVIAAAADRAGIPCTLRNNSFFDTLRMARIYGESPTNSLEQLRQHFNIELEGAHRAMNDVVVNMAVFKFLAKRYRTTEELSEMLSRPIQLKNMPLGPHKGRPMKEVPLDYLIWASNRNYDKDLMFTIRTEIKKRKKGNLFSQVTNPFSGL
jgi:DNA polymerase III subunit epsilon